MRINIFKDQLCALAAVRVFTYSCIGLHLQPSEWNHRDVVNEAKPDVIIVPRSVFICANFGKIFAWESFTFVTFTVTFTCDIYQFRKPLKCRNGAMLTDWFPLRVIICDLIFGAFRARIYRTCGTAYFNHSACWFLSLFSAKKWSDFRKACFLSNLHVL